MNKNDLIGAVAEASGLSRSDATKAVEGVFDTITGALSKGDEVRLVGFGTFATAERKAGTGRNPRTGEEVRVPDKVVPYFKTGKDLRERLNQPAGGDDAWEDTLVGLAGDDDGDPCLDQHRGERCQLGVDRRFAQQRFERERDGQRHGTAAYGRSRAASNVPMGQRARGRGARSWSP